MLVSNKIIYELCVPSQLHEAFSSFLAPCFPAQKPSKTRLFSSKALK